MKTIELDKDKKGNTFFVVTFPYEPEIVEAIKQIPNRKFDGKSKNWLIKSDHTVVQYIEVFAQYFGFIVDSKCITLLEKLKKPATEDIELPPLKATLRQFQKLGVAYATKYERCFIADDMGLGKSCQSIVSVETLKGYPCLVVVPSSVKLNWQREVDMWVNRSTLIISGEKPLDDYKADFVIINYDIIGKHESLLKKVGFKSIILDESHYLKSHKSQRTKSVKSISSKIKYRFALSGTPLLNKPRELMPQLDILGRLDNFGGFWSFAKKYCGAVEGPFGWDFSGATNLDELYTKLKDMCFIRRLKKDVLTELPDKQRTYIPIEIDNRKEYKLAEKDFIKWAKTRLMKPEQYLSEIEKLDHLTAAQKKFLFEAKMKMKINKVKDAEALIQVEYLKQLVADGKMAKFIEFIDNFIQSGEKMVVFASHIKIQRELYEHYRQYNVARIFAEDNVETRQENIDKFQTDPNCPLMITSLAAGGIGITLTAASRVAFMEFGWTPAIHDQAEDRCHRIGQKNAVDCYYFYGKNTIDEKIMELIENKRAITQNVSDGISMEINDLTIQEILKKFI